MSNYVSNQLIITGPEAALQQFEQRAKGVWPWRQWDLPDDYRRALMVTEFIPPPLYAINDYSNKGWNWCINVLGTKHGAFDAQVEHGIDQLTYLFTTANTGLSSNVLEAMSVQFPGLIFEYQYDEPGCEFEGEIRAEGGEVTDEWEREGERYEGILCGPPERGEEVAEEVDHP